MGHYAEVHAKTAKVCWDNAKTVRVLAAQSDIVSVELGHIIERLSQIKDTLQKLNEALLQKKFNEAHHFAGFVDLQVENLKRILPVLR